MAPRLPSAPAPHGYLGQSLWGAEQQQQPQQQRLCMTHASLSCPSQSHDKTSTVRAPGRIREERERKEGAAGGREIKLHGLMVGALTEDTWKFKGKKKDSATTLDYICTYNTQAWEHSSPTNKQKKLQSCSTKRGGSDKREIVGEGSASSPSKLYWKTVQVKLGTEISYWSLLSLKPTALSHHTCSLSRRLFSVAVQHCIFQLSPCMFLLVGRLLILFFHRAKEVMWCEVWYSKEWCLRKRGAKQWEHNTVEPLKKLN